MEKIFKFLAIILLTLVFFTIACTKKGSSPEQEGPEKPAVPVVPETPKNPDSNVKLLSPESIRTDNLKIDFQYDGKNSITEIRQSDGTREIITYKDNNQLGDYKRYLKDNLLYQVYYVTNAEGLVTKGIRWAVEADGKLKTLIGNYQISYNEQKQIETVDWYDFQNMLVTTKTFIYNDKLLLTEEKITGLSPAKKAYNYDDHTGIFKQVPFVQIFSLENQAFYLLNGRSNVTTIKTENEAATDLSFVMQYNKEGYPSTITQTDATRKTKVFKVTYR